MSTVHSFPFCIWENMRLRKLRSFAQGHTADKGQSWDLIQVSLKPTALEWLLNSRDQQLYQLTSWMVQEEGQDRNLGVVWSNPFYTCWDVQEVGGRGQWSAEKTFNSRVLCKGKSYHGVCVHACSVMSDSLQPQGVVAFRAPLSMDFPGSGVPFPSPRNLPDPGIKLTSSALAKFFTINATWKYFLPFVRSPYVRRSSNSCIY